MEHTVTDRKAFQKAVLRQLLMAYARTGKIPSLNVPTQERLDAIVLLVEDDLITVLEGLNAVKKMIERIGG